MCEGGGVVYKNRYVDARRRSSAWNTNRRWAGRRFVRHMRARRRSALACALACALARRGGAAGRDFVRVVAANAFARGCETFAFAGFNAYALPDIAAERAADAMFGVDHGRGRGRRAVEIVLDRAREGGMNAARTWAFSVNALRPTWRRDDEGRLRHDETFLIGLDRVVEEIARRDMVVVLALADHWHTVSEFLKECAGDAEAPTSEFYASPACRDMYKWHAGVILRRYADEPAVAAWNLINEPRCRGCDDALQDWIEDAATFVKSIASKQLVTVGAEGFYSGDSANVAANPASWAATTGQDFVRNHAPDAIDFASIHLWRDNWAVYSTAARFDAEGFGLRWLDAHEADARVLRKPIVVEEFGAAPGGVRALARSGEGREGQLRRTSIRDERGVERYYRSILSRVHQSIADEDRGYIRGALFWGLFPESMRSAVDRWDPYAVYPSDAAFAQAARFASSTGRLASTIASCNETVIKKK